MNIELKETSEKLTGAVLELLAVALRTVDEDTRDNLARAMQGRAHTVNVLFTFETGEPQFEVTVHSPERSEPLIEATTVKRH